MQVSWFAGTDPTRLPWEHCQCCWGLSVLPPSHFHSHWSGSSGLGEGITFTGECMKHSMVSITPGIFSQNMLWTAILVP